MGLNVLTGQLGRIGAGIFAKPGLAFPLTLDKLQRPDLVPQGTRTLNIVDVGRHLLDQKLDPPIKGLFIYNHNPVCTHPDQNRMRRGLSRDDLFIVGCDVVMTDSMTYADVILPASSHFEFDDIYAAYGQSYLQRAAPVISSVAESLPNTEIFRRLAARFGFEDRIFRESDAQLIDAAVNPGDPRLNGCQPSKLPLGRSLMMNTLNGEPVMMCNTVEPATSKLPLMLISPSSSKRTNATFGSDAASQMTEIIEIHPDDAVSRGITHNQLVRLWNDLGQVELCARINDSVAPGVVYSPKGTWLNTSSTGQTVNALISADLKTDIMDGACYNDTFVDCAPEN
jgi:anaerobic selenocysteine-containing dehydrogenase